MFEETPNTIYDLPTLDEDGYFCGMTSVMNDPATGEPLLPPNVVQAEAPCEDISADENFYHWNGKSWDAEKKPVTCEDFVAFGPVSHTSQTSRFNELRTVLQAVSENNEEYRVDRGSNMEWIMVKVPEKTEEEKQLEAAKAEMDTLKRYLDDTDYVVVKIAEGTATKEEYADVLTKREETRERIRELEVEIANLEGDE